MQRAVAAALAFTLLTPSFLAESPLLDFNAPGQFASQESSAAGGEWVVLVFDSSPAAFDFEFQSTGAFENLTWTYPIRAYNRTLNVSPQAYGQRTYAEIPAGASYQIEMPDLGRSSLFIEADRIDIETGPIAGRFAEKPDSAGISDFVRVQDEREKVHRLVKPAGDHAVVQFQPEGKTTFSLQAKGPRHIEWHGASVICNQSNWCPEGGPTRYTRLPAPGDLNVTSEQYVYEIVTSGVRDIEGGGSVSYAIFGGRALTFSVNEGRLRLPFARLSGSCADCLDPANQTLTAGGNLTLTGLRRLGDDTLETQLGGTASLARLDESAVDPRTLLGVGTAAAAAAAVALSLVALKLLGVLFTKWHDRDILNLPKRRLVHDVIVQHPGVGFRELTRLTGLAVGTVRHHLDVLLRHGRIVEKKQGAALRFFENHGKYDRTWSRVAVLRDEPTRLVHDWLAQNPDRSQNELLAALESQGFSKTATQRRLHKLLTAGLASVQQRGRFKLYRAI